MSLLPFIIPHRQAEIVYPLIAAIALTAFMTIYRFVVTVTIYEQSYNFENYNNIIAVLSTGAICLWCIKDLTFRFSLEHKTKDYTSMKNISLIAAICCLLRLISATVYFYIRMAETNTVSVIYVVCDLVLWAVLTLYFLNTWSEKKEKEQKRLKYKKQQAEANHDK